MVKQHERFPSPARKYLADMISAQDALQNLYGLFAAGKEVRCYHCDFVISSLTSFNEPVQLFDRLLREVDTSPISFSLSYYILIVAVGQIDEQGHQLKSMINTYRPHCRSYAKTALRQKHEIQHKLKKFVQSAETLLQEVSHFIEETHFLEKQQQHTHQEQQSTIAHHYNKYEPDIVHQERDTIIRLRLQQGVSPLGIDTPRMG